MSWVSRDTAQTGIPLQKILDFTVFPKNNPECFKVALLLT